MRLINHIYDYHINIDFHGIGLYRIEL